MFGCAGLWRLHGNGRVRAPFKSPDAEQVLCISRDTGTVRSGFGYSHIPALQRDIVLCVSMGTENEIRTIMTVRISDE